MIRKIFFPSFLLFVFTILCVKNSTAISVGSQNFEICPIITAGGGLSISPSSGTKLYSVIGQPAIGSSSSTGYKLNLGLYDSCIIPLLQSPYSEQDVYVTGDLNYLNVYWQAEYPIGSFNPNRPIAVNCNLNDFASSQRCIPFPYLQDPGLGTCSVPAPQYIFATIPSGDDGINSVSCNIFDPNNPTFSVWSNGTFKPISFEVTVAPSISVTLDQEFDLPIHVKNLGLLEDNYTIELTPITGIVLIENSQNTVQNVKTNEIGSSDSRIKLLVANPMAPAQVHLKVSSDVSCNFSPNGCILFERDLTIQGQANSLPDFDNLAIIQIIFISAIILSLVSFKKSKHVLKQ